MIVFFFEIYVSSQIFNLDLIFIDE